MEVCYLESPNNKTQSLDLGPTQMYLAIDVKIKDDRNACT